MNGKWVLENWEWANFGGSPNGVEGFLTTQAGSLVSSWHVILSTQRLRMSLTNRAIVALCLMVGFYLLALSVAAGLVWIAYADWAYRDRLDRIEIACVIAAVM